MDRQTDNQEVTPIYKAPYGGEKNYTTKKEYYKISPLLWPSSVAYPEQYTRMSITQKHNSKVSHFSNNRHLSMMVSKTEIVQCMIFSTGVISISSLRNHAKI